MFFGSGFSFGFEVGVSHLLWAAINTDSKECHVYSVPLESSREGRHDRKELADMIEPLREAVEVCRKAVPKWSRTVTVGVPTGCLGGYLELPKLSDKELETAVPSAVFKQMPWSLEDVMLKLVKVRPIKGQGQVGICYFAVKQAAIQEQKSVLKELGLKISSIEPLPVSLHREFMANHPDEKECVALLSISDKESHLLVLNNHEPYYYRSFTPGYADFVYGYQMDRQCSWREAVVATDETSVEGAIFWEPFLLKMEKQLSRSLKSFRSVTSTFKPVKIYLSGNFPPGLEKRIANSTGLNCEVDGWDAFKPSDFSTQQDPAAFKVAIGAALI